MESWQVIVLLGAAAAAGAFILPKKNPKSPESSADKTVRNMETALEQFMENMEADNREMVELVTKTQKEAQQMALQREARITELEKRCADLESSLAKRTDAPNRSSVTIPDEYSIVRATDAASSAPSETPHNPEAIQTPVAAAPTIRSRYTELFGLYDAGKSVEAVARKLGMNKGEVQLILQLSKREEELRHE